MCEREEKKDRGEKETMCVLSYESLAAFENTNWSLLVRTPAGDGRLHYTALAERRGRGTTSYRTTDEGALAWVTIQKLRCCDWCSYTQTDMGPW